MGKGKTLQGRSEKQRLDDLVFEYCKTVDKLRPKVAILENVPGIIAGRAKKYAINIVELLDEYGYDTQIFSLNSATMGVPQSRERVFFIARRRDLNLDKLALNFNVEPIVTKAIIDKNSTTHKKLWPSIVARLPYVEYGEQNLKFADAKYRNKKTYNAFFSTQLLYGEEVPATITAQGVTIFYPEKRSLNDNEYRKISNFPLDYDFGGYDVRYICGMSVPPLMIKGVAEEIRRQWFKDSLKGV